MFKQYQQVQLKLKTFKDTFFGKLVELKEGQRGIVMDVLVMPDLPIGYNVEFFDNSGKTIAVSTLEEKNLAPIADSTTQQKL
jgi:hypothetical protein